MKTNDHIDKPWGWEDILELNDHYCIKRLFITGGHRFSKQYHERKTETLMLTSGEAELTVGTGDAESVVTMVPGEPHTIAPGTVHRLKAVAGDGALILEVSTPELEDVVRVEDDYGRSGT
jgi:mannose-6-phosphate isomerase